VEELGDLELAGVTLPAWRQDFLRWEHFRSPAAILVVALQGKSCVGVKMTLAWAGARALTLEEVLSLPGFVRFDARLVLPMATLARLEGHSASFH